MKALTTLTFFAEFESDPSFTPFLYKSIEAYQYKVYPVDSTVFLYGERGDSIYFVLRGKAAILIPKSEQDKLVAFKLQNKYNKSKRKLDLFRNTEKESYY